MDEINKYTYFSSRICYLRTKILKLKKKRDSFNAIIDSLYKMINEIKTIRETYTQRYKRGERQSY